MTVSIALVRENAESLKQPRSLWVSFPLGRPLGVPNDAAFQHRVIDAALTLLGRERGPVLEDYGEDVPEIATESAPACPVTFPRDDSSWQNRLASELGTLQPWYQMGLNRRQGRTLVGVSDSSIHEIMRRLAEDLDNQQLPADLVWFKSAIEDAKAYYLEALTAQPGQYDQVELYQTLWHDTQFGAGLRRFYDQFAADEKLSGFAVIVLPREALGEKPDQEIQNEN